MKVEGLLNSEEEKQVKEDIKFILKHKNKVKMVERGLLCVITDGEPDGSRQTFEVYRQIAKVHLTLGELKKLKQEFTCEGCSVMNATVGRIEEGNPGGDNPRNRGVHKRRNFHPTVKPVKLMRYLCRLVTPPRGVILDPFIGSGTTGIAALEEGFNFIGFELNPDYCEIARKRLARIPKRLEEFNKGGSK